MPVALHVHFLCPPAINVFFYISWGLITSSGFRTHQCCVCSLVSWFSWLYSGTLPASPTAQIRRKTTSLDSEEESDVTIFYNISGKGKNGTENKWKIVMAVAVLALLKVHQSAFFLIVKKLIYVSTTAPQRPDSSSHNTNCRMMPCCWSSRPHTLQAPSQVRASECGVCRAGCTTDNNAASRSLTQTHTHSCGPGGWGGRAYPLELSRLCLLLPPPPFLTPEPGQEDPLNYFH